jgi:hypothetical protein
VSLGRKQLGNYLITEYPKSGGSWFGQMLADTLGVMFPRNRLPYLSSQILHGHYLTKSSDSRNIAVVLRDGRDIVVSYYYHCYFENEHFNSRLVSRTKSKLNFDDPENVVENLPAFIDMVFSDPVFPTFTWSEFCFHWLDRNVVFVKYEDLLNDAASEVKAAAEQLTGEVYDLLTIRQITDKYEFSKMAKRKPGSESVNSFLRKGVKGDWKNKFSQAANEAFHEHGGEALVALGYEPDDSWCHPSESRF